MSINHDWMSRLTIGTFGSVSIGPILSGLGLPELQA